MKLKEKIMDRRLAYQFRRKPEIAFELAIFYYILAKRRNKTEKIAAACRGATFWTKKAGVIFPEYFDELSLGSQLEEIEKELVKNRGIIEARTEQELVFLKQYS